MNKRELLRNKRIAEKRRKTQKIIIITLAVILLVAVVILIPNLITRQTSSSEDRGFTIGDPNAPVKVINFSSYSCGFCVDFSETTEIVLINNYVEPGDVFYRYVNLAHAEQFSQNAAIASYCADDQNLFFKYKSFLYGAASAFEGFSINNLVNMANVAGLDANAFRSCLEGSSFSNEPAKDLRFAQSLGITGTPTFIINGELVTAREVIPLIDSLLDR